MKKKSEITFSQWLVMLSVPLTLLAVGGLFRLLWDHEMRMARMEGNCGKAATVSKDLARSAEHGAETRYSLAYPQAPFVGTAYRLAQWLFSPGKAPLKENPK